MTFKEAQKLKDSLPETYHHMGADLEYIIIPALESDKAKYKKYFTENVRSDDIEDEESINYSTNGQFILGGFWCNDVAVIFDDEAPVKL
jgi:hypothetical protein